MGWYPNIVENSIQPNIPEAFWVDLQDELQRRATRREKLLESGKSREEIWKLHKSGDYLYGSDCFYDTYTVDDLKYAAFNSDDMEHIGSWLWDESMGPLLEKHKISGAFILTDEGGSDLYGIILEDGVRYRAHVEVSWKKGEKL